MTMQVEVLASLQRPKKITVCSSDGKSYILLCKPKVLISMTMIGSTCCFRVFT